MKRTAFFILVILMVNVTAGNCFWGIEALSNNGKFGDSSSSLTSVTDLFNGFNRTSGDTYSGGPTLVADNTGTLIKPPVDRMGLEGGRLSYNLAEGATLGPELITNGGFDSDTSWTKGAGFLIQNGVLIAPDVPGATSTTSQTIATAATKTYIVKMDVTAVVGTPSYCTRWIAGSQISWTTRPSGADGTYCNKVGHYETTLLSPATTLQITQTAGHAGSSVDNISVREVIPVWLPYNSAGTPIATSQSIRTRKGTVSKYDSTYKGWLNEPAATNSLLHASDLTNAVWVKTLGTAAKTATGPDGVANSGSTFTATAINGTVLQTLTLASAARSSSVYLRRKTGTGTVNFTRDGVTWTNVTSLINSSTYTRVKIDNTSVLNPVIGVQLATSGDAVDFYNAQDTAGAFTTSPIPTTTATVTRPATNYLRPSAGILRSNSFAIWQRVVPSAAGQATVDLWSARSDASNLLEIYMNATQVRLYKVVGGAFAGPVATYTHAANTPFEVQAYQHTSGMGIRVKQDGGSWSAWSETTDATSLLPIVVPSSYQVGAMNNAAHFTGNIPFTSVIHHSDPRAELERLANQYP